MIKGCIYIVRGQELKLTLPGPSVTIKKDGSIWCQGMPVLGLTDPADKKSAAAAIKAGRYEDIPADAYTRLGDNPNGLWAGDDDAFAVHPAKLAADKIEAAKRIEEAKIITIYLSSRGWGDFNSCNWVGDITRPDAEILTECKHRLAVEHDVDKPDQSDETLLGLIHAARAKWGGAPAAKTAMEKAEKEDIENKMSSGYCFNCESWCMGDCGNYSVNPSAKFRKDFEQAVAEQNYGIQEG